MTLDGVTFTCLFAAARRRSSSKPVLLTEAQKQLMVHKLPQVLRLHLKRFRYDDVTPVNLRRQFLIFLRTVVMRTNSSSADFLSGPQVVWAKPPGEDRSPRQLRPASQHGALLLPRALTQSCVLLQSQQPHLCGLAAP